MTISNSIKNSTKYFRDPALLDHLPLTRAAYSDRTAWILAVISWLAYDTLPGEDSIEQLVRQVEDAAKQRQTSQLRELLQRAMAQGLSVDSNVQRELESVGFEFKAVFNSGGTQAFLALLQQRQDRSPMLILAFRGTEISSPDDVMADLDLRLVPVDSGGRVHSGFHKAFQTVRDKIEAVIADPIYQDYPLYISGHSLGAALAMLATRYLTHPRMAATYTYGCPRAADEAFYACVKTPVYRIVNAADGVARVPFGRFTTALLRLIDLIPINGTHYLTEWIRRTILGYTHYGNLVFLSDAAATLDGDGIQFPELQVVHGPDLAWRLWEVWKRLLVSRGKALIDDHNIEIYARKLFANAQRRLTS